MSKVKPGVGAVVRQVPVRALQINDFCASYGLGRSKAYALIREESFGASWLRDGG
jgi:predicted DNA-binding transcriptional regulator AlpA